MGRRGRGPEITVVILTLNEEKHVSRAIESVKDIATECLVVDSGSIDKTVDIARAHGAKVLLNGWVNYATQFNWAVSQLPVGTDWVFRLDADEVVTSELSFEIREKIEQLEPYINGIYVNRRMCFMGNPCVGGGFFQLEFCVCSARIRGDARIVGWTSMSS